MHQRIHYRSNAREAFDYRLLFEESTEGMLVFTLGGDMLDANLEAQLLIGKRQEDLLAAGRDGIFDPTDSRLGAALVEVERSGRFRGELRLLRRGEATFDAEVSMISLPERMLGAVFYEVTGYDQALRESEERFRITFDQAAVGIAHMHLGGRWLRVNRRFCEIVGYDHEELLELAFQDIIDDHDLGANLEQLSRVLSGEIETFSIENRCIKDCSRVWINLTVSLVRKPSGDPNYFICVVDDIDERKRAEEQLCSLTCREMEVLKLLIRGCTNKEMSRKMSFSVGTIKTHMRHITAKLGGSGRAEAAARAVELGLAKANSGTQES